MSFAKNADFWVKNNLNVLFRGRHGTGKTSVCIDIFNRHKLRWKYFSTSTLDPWVDLVGVPREATDEKGNVYLDLVRPKDFACDEVDAIFLDEFNRCLTGDTRILCPDGQAYAIRDLVGKESFYVYSFNHTTNEVCIGRGHSARVTQKKAKIFKVTLDNGAVIRCTGDHPFLLKNGTYKQAMSLTPTDSLMPLYKTWNHKGYEKVFQPKQGFRWDFTYLIANEFNIEKGNYRRIKGGHAHHVNLSKDNNSPDNIKMLTEIEHIRIHQQDTEGQRKAGKLTHVLHPDLIGRTIGTEESNLKAVAASTATRSTCKVYKQKRSALSKQYFAEGDHKYRQAKRCKAGWAKGQFSKIDRAAAMVKNYQARTLNLLDDQGLVVETEAAYLKAREAVSAGQGQWLAKLDTVKRMFGSFDAFLAAHQERRRLSAVVGPNSNHRILSVVQEGVEDVYDITVDDHHNFALEAGVFVHNSPKKVKNAVMELLQFKSINGKRFNNLKIVWAAINPDDDADNSYDVDKMDPAQLDRFHVHVDVPYQPDLDFFVGKYGDEVGKGACEWWNGQKDDVKKIVSPRRLDYAVTIFGAGGDLKDVLPNGVNLKELEKRIRGGSFLSGLKAKLGSGKKADVKKFVNDENTFKGIEALFDKIK